MGILDDAIREHLDLKRAHGADEEEVRRKEAEAFGPVRQEVVAPALDDDATQMLHPDLEPEPLEPSTDDPRAVHPGDDPVPDPHDHAHPPVGSDPAWGEDTEFFADPVRAPAEPPVHHHDDEPHPALHDHDAIHAEEHPPEPVFRDHAAAPVEEPPPVQEPPVREPEVDEPPVGEPGEEDVLEDTPEFLQDAPEHDRLWFEQKPPRDFDFGE
jgi:hypothetical protein